MLYRLLRGGRLTAYIRGIQVSGDGRGVRVTRAVRIIRDIQVTTCKSMPSSVGDYIRGVVFEEAVGVVEVREVVEVAGVAVGVAV